jgi:hypothetical protein
MGYGWVITSDVFRRMRKKALVSVLGRGVIFIEGTVKNNLVKLR